MIKKIIFSSILGSLLVLSFCSRLKYDVIPHKTAVYNSLRIKVNVKKIDTNQKESFKILLKYDDSRDKMFFLSPLNQVYGLLFLEGEEALLINTKKKKYWKGKFRSLLQEIWRLDFDYREFKQLLVEGVVPKEKIKEQDIDVLFEEEPTGANAGDSPRRLKIISGEIWLNIKISPRKTGNGIISFSRNLKGMKKSSINELLSGEEEE